MFTKEEIQHEHHVQSHIPVDSVVYGGELSERAGSFDTLDTKKKRNYKQTMLGKTFKFKRERSERQNGLNDSLDNSHNSYIGAHNISGISSKLQNSSSGDINQNPNDQRPKLMRLNYLPKKQRKLPAMGQKVHNSSSVDKSTVLNSSMER